MDLARRRGKWLGVSNFLIFLNFKDMNKINFMNMDIFLNSFYRKNIKNINLKDIGNE